MVDNVALAIAGAQFEAEGLAEPVDHLGGVPVAQSRV